MLELRLDEYDELVPEPTKKCCGVKEERCKFCAVIGCMLSCIVLMTVFVLYGYVVVVKYR